MCLSWVVPLVGRLVGWRGFSMIGTGIDSVLWRGYRPKETIGLTGYMSAKRKYSFSNAVRRANLIEKPLPYSASR